MKKGHKATTDISTDGGTMNITAQTQANSAQAKDFWDKLKAIAKKAGKAVMRPALILWYTFLKPTTPLWAKAVIVGALIYLITPIDAIPDYLPVVGFTDDAAALAAAAH